MALIYVLLCCTVIGSDRDFETVVRALVLPNFLKSRIFVESGD